MGGINKREIATLTTARDSPNHDHDDDGDDDYGDDDDGNDDDDDVDDEEENDDDDEKVLSALRSWADELFGALLVTCPCKSLIAFRRILMVRWVMMTKKMTVMVLMVNLARYGYLSIKSKLMAFLSSNPAANVVDLYLILDTPTNIYSPVSRSSLS